MIAASTPSRSHCHLSEALEGVIGRLPTSASALNQAVESPTYPDMARRVCLAIESTHWGAESNGRLVEIGAIELRGDYATGKQFHAFLDPQCDVDKFMLKEHGLTKEYLFGKPIFSEIAASLVTFISDAALVTFDMREINWLDLELSRCGHPTVGSICTSLDETATMYRNAHANESNESIRMGLRALHEIDPDLPIKSTTEKAYYVAKAFLSLKR
ncbi:MAG: exonuclease domain-containing protein [Rugosibacter sp.]|nr:exonuclease domain-containing protein [Rugosibacter sp.]